MCFCFDASVMLFFDVVENKFDIVEYIFDVVGNIYDNVENNLHLHLNEEVWGRIFILS